MHIHASDLSLSQQFWGILATLVYLPFIEAISMMTSISSTAKELKRIMDVEQRFLVNFGILVEKAHLYDRFYKIFALKSL